MKKEELIILCSSDEAASIKTVTGWVSRTGRWFGNDERLARYEGGTHKLCEGCGKVVIKYQIKCDACSSKDIFANYNKMPFKEWDGKTPLVMYHDDKFFFDEDDITDYAAELIEEGEKIEDINLRLVICEPNHYQEVELGYWDDVWTEDGEPSKEFCNKLDEFNAFLKAQKPPSWSPGKYRTEYILDLKDFEA